MRALLAFLLCFISLYTYGTGVGAADSLAEIDKTVQVRPRKFIVPASLILIGSLGVGNGWIKSVNRGVRDDMAHLRGNCYFHADDYLQYLPAVSQLGLGAIGAKCRHSFKERLIVTATSYLAMGIMVNSLKYTTNERRPDGSARNSFPSGHTATAFMGAELVRTEYGTGYGIGAYLVASGVAFLRLYNNKHWLNDVIAGAGIGILSARIGYWLLPANRKLFRMQTGHSPVTIAAAPTYDYRNGAFGIAIAARF